MTSIASRRLPFGKKISWVPGEPGTTDSRMAEGDREALKT